MSITVAQARALLADSVMYSARTIPDSRMNQAIGAAVEQFARESLVVVSEFTHAVLANASGPQTVVSVNCSLNHDAFTAFLSYNDGEAKTKPVKIVPPGGSLGTNDYKTGVPSHLSFIDATKFQADMVFQYAATVSIYAHATNLAFADYQNDATVIPVSDSLIREVLWTGGKAYLFDGVLEDHPEAQQALQRFDALIAKIRNEVQPGGDTGQKPGARR